MDILVIGNGFDLAHGLKTTYKDFLLACQKDKLPDEFKDFCQNNVWLKHFIIKQKDLEDTWIDLEKEIYSAIHSLHNRSWFYNDTWAPHKIIYHAEEMNCTLENIDSFSKDTSEDYITGRRNYRIIHSKNKPFYLIFFKNKKGVTNFLYDQLREFTYAFEYYLDKIVLAKLGNKSKYILSLQSRCKSLSILSFNYTDTCERLYRKDFAIKTYYVHGKINCSNNTCKLVLGTHSFDNKPQNENPRSAIPYEFNVFRKHNQRHKYGTIEAYQELLNELQKSGKPIFHVIGHSLDETDKKILKHLFITNKNAIINIYYHDEEAQENYINNITEIIEEEEVMRRVRLIYQHDKTRGILKEKVNV